MVVGGGETVSVGTGLAAVAGLRGGLTGAVGAEGETTLCSVSTGNSEGMSFIGSVGAAFLPSAAAGKSEGSFPFMVV